MAETLRHPPAPSRSNWWVWLLAALAVIAVLGLLYQVLVGDDDSQPLTVTRTTTVTVTRPATSASTPASPETITKLSTLTDPEQPDELTGRPVRLTGVPVHAVAADRVFWVGPSQAHRLMVVLPAHEDRGSAERRISVRAGRTVDVTGVVRQLPSGRDELRRRFDLGGLDLLTLAGEQIYVQADSVTIRG